MRHKEVKVKKMAYYYITVITSWQSPVIPVDYSKWDMSSVLKKANPLSFLTTSFTIKEVQQLNQNINNQQEEESQLHLELKVYPQHPRQDNNNIVLKAFLLYQKKDYHYATFPETRLVHTHQYLHHRNVFEQPAVLSRQRRNEGYQLAIPQIQHVERILSHRRVESNLPIQCKNRDAYQPTKGHYLERKSPYQVVYTDIKKISHGHRLIVADYPTRDVYCKVQNNNKLSTTFLVTIKDADIKNQAISVNGDVQEPVADVNGVLQVRRDQFVLSRNNHNEISDDPGDELVMLPVNSIHRLHYALVSQQEH